MRRRMNKIMAAMLIGAMTASLALTGCGGKKSASKDGKKELTVWAWDVALMQLEEAAEEYQKDHPDVTFKFEEMGTDQIYKKLSTSLATGNGIADIIAIEGDVLVGYADKFPEGFLDVSDAINTDDFLASKIGEVSYKDKIHAFPWDAGPAAMFYRTDYFEQAGVNPEDIQTWDDLIEAGKWSVMDLPKVDGGEYSVSNGGSDLTINAKTDYPDEAKDFVKFAMTDTKLQASGFEKYGLYPSYIPSYEEEIFQKGDSFFGDTNIYEIFIENGKNVAEIPISPNAQEAGDSIGAAVSKIFLNGADVKSTMEDLEDELTTKFK